jgi:phosphoribosyl 1,2-cyclic phosphodiesterase
MRIGITALGSGSNGNAFVIHSPDGAILVDAGFSRKEILRRMDETGVIPETICGVLITHEHDDHVRGCRLLCSELRIPAIVSYRTADYLRKLNKLPDKVMEFSPGSNFVFAGFNISPFAVQHDAVEPVGFLIRKCGRAIALATDLGIINTLAQQRLFDCDILVLESNYDRDMLYQSERQLYLKRRIMGRNGHLDNNDACSKLPELLSPRTAALFLVHVSSECNSYELVEQRAAAVLKTLQRDDILLRVVTQDNAVETFWLAPSGELLEL